MFNQRLRRQWLGQLSMAVLLAGVLTIGSLVMLQFNALAAARGKGAFGCGALDQATIDASAPGDTIMFMVPETASAGPITIYKELIIQGGWGPKSGDCNDTAPNIFDTITDALVVFNYDPNAVSDLPAPIDFAVPPGPVMVISPALTSTFTLQQLKFDNNVIDNRIGAGVSGVISNSARGYMAKVAFDNNQAQLGGQGGGIGLTVTGGSRLQITMAEFTNNFASGQGGGARLIIQNNSTVLIANSVFSNSNNGLQGGGLYAEVRGGSHLVISQSQFIGNFGQNSGGGFEIRVYDGSQVTIDQTQVTSNTSPAGNGGGGRILIDSGSVTIRNSTFSGNQALSGSGGGLSVEGIGSGPAYLLRQNSLITGNAALTDANLHVSGNVIVLTEQLFLPVVLKN